MANTGNNQGAPNNGQNVELTQAPLTVRGQYIKDLSFESPNAPDILASPLSDPQINFDVNVEVNGMGEGEGDTQDFEVVLAIRADAKSGGKQAFLVELSYAGVFGLGKEIPEEQHAPVLMIECARLLFPFARQIIADATQEGGFMPLLMPPLDFGAIYEQQAKQMMAEQGGAN